MSIFKVVFTSKNASTNDELPSSKNYTYRIEADSFDEAIGLAQIEFSQKLPKLAHAEYIPHVIADDGSASSSVHTFVQTEGSNPDP